MKCPRCTHKNPPGVKFCNDCGQRMGTLCTGCNALNLPKSNFCHQCGQFLPKTNGFFSDEKPSGQRLPDVEKTSLPHAATGERKYVTVLFSDLSGYTTLAQRLDPEEIKEIISQLSREITKIVTKYEGFIEKIRWRCRHGGFWRHSSPRRRPGPSHPGRQRNPRTDQRF